MGRGWIRWCVTKQLEVRRVGLQLLLVAPSWLACLGGLDWTPPPPLYLTSSSWYGRLWAVAWRVLRQPRYLVPTMLVGTLHLEPGRMLVVETRNLKPCKSCRAVLQLCH